MLKQASNNFEEMHMARQRRDRATSIEEYRVALFDIMHVEYGLDAELLTEALGMNRSTKSRNRSNHRTRDVSLNKKWGGRRSASMTFEEEREFLAIWKEKAYQGGILTVSPIHAALAERLGHGTTMSTTYRLLARHGWRKVILETSKHENQAVLAGQFSKISPKLWQPVD